MNFVFHDTYKCESVLNGANNGKVFSFINAFGFLNISSDSLDVVTSGISVFPGKRYRVLIQELPHENY